MPMQHATGEIGGYARKPDAPSTREARRIPSRLWRMGVQYAALYAAVEGPRAVSYCLLAKSKPLSVVLARGADLPFLGVR
jgi:hypothetical protein